jgi:septal ring factor EnvC (AmiA/AmiB activator)
MAHTSRMPPRTVLRGGVATVMLVALAPVLLSQSLDRARTEALARRATERLQALQHEADALASQERTLLGDLRKLDIDRQLKAEELRQIAADSTQVAAELSANAQRTRDLERQESSGRPELRSRLVDIYKLGQGRYLRLLLSTTDIRQIGQAARTLSALAKLDHERIVSRQRTLDELRRAHVTLEERRRQLEGLRVRAQGAEAALTHAAKARNDLVRDIDSRRDLNSQLVGELQAANQKLQVTLRDLASASADAATLPIRPFRGDLEWPVTSSGVRRSSRSASSPLSAGIDINAAEGAPVAAVHDGVVAYADAFGGFGNLVIVDHGAQSFSLYGNLLDMSVAKGARVERGDAVGTVGPAPAGPPELHFELRIDGQSVDPLQWLRKR